MNGWVIERHPADLPPHRRLLRHGLLRERRVQARPVGGPRRHREGPLPEGSRRLGRGWISPADGMDREVLLRSDGTSLYITQDIGVGHPAVQGLALRPADLRGRLRAAPPLPGPLQGAGTSSAIRGPRSLHHLAYGMVNLPEGKMKSREGTVVDADDLLDELERLAAEEITDQGAGGGGRATSPAPRGTSPSGR